MSAVTSTAAALEDLSVLAGIEMPKCSRVLAIERSVASEFLSPSPARPATMP